MFPDEILDQDKITRIKTILKLNPKGLTITEISQKLKISRIALTKYLDVLLVAGHVEMRMYGAAKVFFLSSRVPISAMLGFSSDFILILDSDLRILQVNEAFLRFLGIDKKDLLGKKFSSGPLDFLNQLPLQSYIDTMAEQGEYTSEMSVTRGAKTYYLRSKVIPTVFDGGAQGLTIILEDMTGNKLADHDRAFLASIVESSSDAIIGKALDGTIISWNHAAELMYGWTAGEIIGHPLSVLIPEEGTDEISAILERVKRGESVTCLETKRVRKNGELFDVSLTISPVRDNESNVCAMSTIARDITGLNRLKEEIRIKEDKVKEIIEFFPDPTFILDRHKKVMGWNKAIEELSGIKKEDIIGKDYVTNIKYAYGTSRPMLIDLLDMTDDELNKKYPEITRAGDGIYMETFIPDARNGEGLYLGIRASPLIDQKGVFIGAIETVKDISAWKKAEITLKEDYQKILHDLDEAQNSHRIEKETLLNDFLRNQRILNALLSSPAARTVVGNPALIIDSSGVVRCLSESILTRIGCIESDVLGANLYHFMDEASNRSLHELFRTSNTKSAIITCAFPLKGRTVIVELEVALLQESQATDELFGICTISSRS